MVDSHGRRRRRAVDGEQLLALGAAAVAKAGGEACAKAGRAKEDGVGRAAVVVLVAGASPPPVAEVDRQREGRGARRHNQYITQTDEQEVRKDRVARVGRVLFKSPPFVK